MAYKYKRYVCIGRTPEGKRIRKYFYANSAPELEQKIRAYFIEASRVTNPSEVLFGEYAKKWLETYKAGKSPRTYAMYEDLIGKFGSLDQIQLRRIVASDLQRLVNDHWDRPRLAQLLQLTLKQIFDRAIDDGIIAQSPARSLEAPKTKAAEKRIFTEKELKAIREANLPDPERLFVSIMLAFGLRPGEAVALQRRQFDLGRKILRVDQAVTYTANTAILKGTKTEAVREIPIPDQLLPVLRSYFAEHSDLCLFPMRGGQFMSKSSYRCFCDRIFSAVNLKLGGTDKISALNGMTMYTFRHNRATELYYLCQKGTISTKKAAALMGHSEAVFLRIYSHLREENEGTDQIYADLVI